MCSFVKNWYGLRFKNYLRPFIDEYNRSEFLPLGIKWFIHNYTDDMLYRLTMDMSL